MLNATTLNDAVIRSVSDGVVMASLLDAAGTTLSTAFGEDVREKEALEAFTVAAVTNVWRAYAHSDLAVNKVNLKVEEHALEEVLLNMGERKMCIMSAADSYIVCLVSADPAMEMGMLKLKTAALQRTLDRLLRPVAVQ